MCLQVGKLGLSAGLKPYWEPDADPSSFWWAQDRAARAVYTKCAQPCHCPNYVDSSDHATLLSGF